MAKLGENISASQTSFHLVDYVSSAELPANGGVIQIDTEEIHYSGTTDIELIGCTRGFNGSTAASHLRDASITLLSADVNVSPVVNITETQRDNILSPSKGMLIYNTDTDKLNVYNGTDWEVITSV